MCSELCFQTLKIVKINTINKIKPINNFLYLPCSSEKINVINMKKLFFAGLLTAIVGGSVVAASLPFQAILKGGIQ